MEVEPRIRTIGDRVRSCRRYRSLSLQVLADRSGLSKSFLSMVENGQRRLERRQHVAAVADALQVSIADLTGQPYPPANPGQGAAHACVPGVRLALTNTSLDDAGRPSNRPVDQLVQATAELMDLRHACEYERVGQILASLLPDLHAGVTSADRQSALQATVLACQAATLWLKDLGYLDLAWIAADRGHQAARRLDDPLWSSAADFARGQALIGLGAYQQVAQIAERAAESTPRATSQGLQVYATHRLTHALASAATGTDNTAEALAEAHDIAARTGPSKAFWLAFGPANVAQWEMSVTLERSEPGRVAEIAAGVDVTQITAKSRKAAYYLDLGVALSRTKGHDPQATAVLRQAERLSPDRVRNQPVVRESVDAMLQRARTHAVARDLRGLAHRVGVPH
jgi:transcriptional regulator with XRE-family HTH domain